MTRKRMLALDTETTGLNFEDGDRLVEIGVVEYLGLTPTGRVYHTFVNPEGREVHPEAVKVHGITNEKLKNAPRFEEIVEEFLDFIGDDLTLIYNAPFDLGFLNGHLGLIDRAPLSNPIDDVMQIARKRFPRRKLTLDIVAKRLGVDTSRRTMHGSLVDAEITGECYRKMTEQDELVMASVESAVVSPDIKPVERKPVLVAPIPLESLVTLPHAVTSYTLLDSALNPDSAVKGAKKAGYQAIGIADKATTAGALEFAAAAAKEGIKPLVGVEIPLQNSEGRGIVLYARNETGWNNIQRLVTIHNVDQNAGGLTSKHLRDHSEGIAALSGGSDGAIAQILKKSGPEAALKTARFLSAIYPQAFAIEISRHAGRVDPVTEAGLLAIAHGLNVPVIGTAIARSMPGEGSLLEIMRAIGSGNPYHAEDNNLETIRTPAETYDLFKDMPIAVDNAAWLASLCDFSPSGTKPMLPRYDTGDETEGEALLRQAKEGLETHLKDVPADKHDIYWKRFDYEYGLIESQGFSGYFLIVADFITWAKQNKIPVGPGRGSGAGSIIAWAMGITGLDPLRFNLLFERFINPERVSLPDFDVDFCEDRREEVIAYARRKYGEDKVVAIATYGRFKTKMAVKDAGRVMGLPYGMTDRIAKELDSKEEMTAEVFNRPEIKSLITTTEAREALDFALKLGGLVRQKGKHAAGIVISDKTVSHVASLDRDPNKPDQLMTQYDMKIVEKTGLVKFDFLGLSTLTAIQHACDILAEKGIVLDPWTLPLEDKATYDILGTGQMVGVFQMESGGMIRAARDVRINNFEDIIALVALYRPGPMDNIPLYARRKKGLEPLGTPHPKLDKVVRDTYGILIYQEQVMEAAQVLAGYSLGGADLLRRAMGKKIQAEMDAQRTSFTDGCLTTNGIPKEKANELFDLIDKFAGYGFNRSHAAAYALIAYVTAYLKAHHAAAYLAGTLQINTNKTDEIVKYAQEARRLGIEFVAPTIHPRCSRFTVDDKGRIVWSLNAIRGIGDAVVQSLINERSKGPFASFRDFIERVGEHVNRAQLTQLAAAGVLDEMFPDRRSALLAVRTTYEAVANEAKAKRAGQGGLFDDHAADAIPVRDEDGIDDKEILNLERGALGITLSAHPLDKHLPRLAPLGIMSPTKASDLLDVMPVAVAAMIDEIKAGKGKGSWNQVRISDERSAITVGCTDDVKGFEMLEAGALLVMRLSAYTTGGERRVRIDEIAGPVEGGKGGSTVRIEVGPTFKRNSLRGLLAEATDGYTRLVVVPKEGSWMITPPMVEIGDDLIESIRALEGVEKVILPRRVA